MSSTVIRVDTKYHAKVKKLAKKMNRHMKATAEEIIDKFDFLVSQYSSYEEFLLNTDFRGKKKQ